MSTEDESKADAAAPGPDDTRPRKKRTGNRIKVPTQIPVPDWVRERQRQVLEEAREKVDRASDDDAFTRTTSPLPPGPPDQE